MLVGPTIFTGDNSMSKETLEKKLNKLEEKIKAYKDAYKLLSDWKISEERSAVYGEAIESILNVIDNMLIMCKGSLRFTERCLEEAG